MLSPDAERVFGGSTSGIRGSLMACVGRLAGAMLAETDGRWYLDEGPEEEAIDAQWLAEVPDRVWEIVRDTVLRCL